MDRPVIAIYFGCTVVGGVTIDCGDGSETEVTTRTERTRYSHSYSAAGNHTIDVKYFKDNYTDNNNDSLQFKVAITLSETPTYSTYWAYTLTNISAGHTIVVTEAVTNKIYAKINGSYVEGKTVYKKISGTWTLQSDLTNVFDNNVNYKVVT